MKSVPARCSQTQSLSPQPLGLLGPSYPEMAKEAVSKALQDSGVPYEAIEAAVSLFCRTGNPYCNCVLLSSQACLLLFFYLLHYHMLIAYTLSRGLQYF